MPYSVWDFFRPLGKALTDSLFHEIVTDFTLWLSNANKFEDKTMAGKRLTRKSFAAYASFGMDKTHRRIVSFRVFKEFLEESIFPRMIRALAVQLVPSIHQHSSGSSDWENDDVEEEEAGEEDDDIVVVAAVHPTNVSNNDNNNDKKGADDDADSIGDSEVLVFIFEGDPFEAGSFPMPRDSSIIGREHVVEDGDGFDVTSASSKYLHGDFDIDIVHL